MNALSSKKLRYELGQSDDPQVDATRMKKKVLSKTTSSVKKLNKEYQAIKIKLKDEGFNHKLVDADMPHAYKVERQGIEEE